MVFGFRELCSDCLAKHQNNKFYVFMDLFSLSMTRSVCYYLTLSLFFFLPKRFVFCAIIHLRHQCTYHISVQATVYTCMHSIFVSFLRAANLYLPWTDFSAHFFKHFIAIPYIGCWRKKVNCQRLKVLPIIIKIFQDFKISLTCFNYLSLNTLLLGKTVKIRIRILTTYPYNIWN